MSKRAANAAGITPIGTIPNVTVDTSACPATARTLSKPCKLWTGKTTSTGYGYVMVDGEPMLAHRYVVWQLTGQMPGVLHHLCEVKLCVELSHLDDVGTQAVHASLHKKDACKHGHLYTKENTYVAPRTGARSCWYCRWLRNNGLSPE